MPRYTDSGYILHKRAYRNHSLLLDVLTKTQGLVRLVYRGGQKKTLVAFQAYWFEYQLATDLGTVYRCEMSDSLIHLSGKSSLCGLYLNELLSYLLVPYAPVDDLFDVYQQTLTSLQQPAECEPSLRRFELYLLTVLGQAVNLSLDGVNCLPVDPEAYYRYVVQVGLIRVDNCADFGQNSLFLGAHLQAIAADNLTSHAVRMTAKRLLRPIIAFHLNGKRLISRDLFHV